MKNKEDGASGKLKDFIKKTTQLRKRKKKGEKVAGKAAKKAAKGVKDADTEDMPVVDREKDAMNKDGASATAGQKRRRLKRAKKRKYGKGQSGKNKEAAIIGREFAAGQMDMMGDIAGPSMYGKKEGSSMNAYQDKEASMDDYSHEKKLKVDGRYEAAHGKMANAKNDFDHAHALKKDAKHDARGRHSIMKHMKGFK